MELANLLFTYALARKRGSSITANALHRGVVSASFGAEDPAAHSDSRSSDAAVHEIAGQGLPHVDPPGVGCQSRGGDGRYFVNCRPRKSSERSYDETAAARLWQMSADLVLDH